MPVPPGVRMPTDHRPPATQAGPEPFTFTGNDGAVFVLPAPTDALALLPGRLLRDAVVEGAEGELRLAFLALEAVEPDPQVLNALYDLPAPDMLDVVGRWMRSRDASGASLPEV